MNRDTCSTSNISQSIQVEYLFILPWQHSTWIAWLEKINCSCSSSICQIQAIDLPESTMRIDGGSIPWMLCEQAVFLMHESRKATIGLQVVAWRVKNCLRNPRVLKNLHSKLSTPYIISWDLLIKVCLEHIKLDGLDTSFKITDPNLQKPQHRFSSSATGPFLNNQNFN